MAKVHFAQSPVPLKERSKLTALCGATVKDARFAAMWDQQQMGGPIDLEGLNSLNACVRCLSVPIDEQYVYGVYEGREGR